MRGTNRATAEAPRSLTLSSPISAAVLVSSPGGLRSEWICYPASRTGQVNVFRLERMRPLWWRGREPLVRAFSRGWRCDTHRPWAGRAGRSGRDREVVPDTLTDPEPESELESGTFDWSAGVDVEARTTDEEAVYIDVQSIQASQKPPGTAQRDETNQPSEGRESK